MVRLTDLQGYSYYMTEANIPERYQRGDELSDVVKFVRVVKDGWYHHRQFDIVAEHYGWLRGDKE